MWIVEVLELKSPDGAPSGIFHLVATSDEGGGVAGCCAHEHRSRAEAGDCPEARENSYRITGVRPPAPPPSVADLARVAFDAYGASTGGKTFDGRDIPPYSVVAEKTPHVARAWEAAVAAVLKASEPRR